MIDWKERYMREVEGLNNEGDPIGGDPLSGLRHQVEALKAENEALQKENNSLKLGYKAKEFILQEAQKEVAKLRSFDADNKGLKECNSILTAENEAQRNEVERLKEENEAQAKRLEEIKGFLEACVDDSMSRNNRQQLAGELLDMFNGDSK